MSDPVTHISFDMYFTLFRSLKNDDACLLRRYRAVDLVSTAINEAFFQETPSNRF